MGKKYILIITNRYLPIVGGSELQIKHLYESLVKRKDINAKILTFRLPTSDRKEYLEGIQIKRIGKADFNSWINRKVNLIVLLLYILVEIKNIDVLDIRSPKSLHSLLAIYIAQKFGKKTVIRFATDGDFEAINTGIEGYVFSKVKIFIDNYIAINSEISEAIISSGVKKEKVILLPNTVDIDKFRPPSKKEKVLLRRKNNLDPNTIYLLFVGRLVKRKGIDLLLNAWSDILEMNIEKDIKLLIIGEGGNRKDSIENMLNNEVDALGIKGKVEFLGEKENISVYYKCSDIFVFPSRREGSPNVVIEAMATGLPVITTKLPGTKDIIDNNKNGILIDVDDEHRLTKEITDLLNGKEKRIELGNTARRFVEAELSLSKAVRVFLDIFE